MQKRTIRSNKKNNRGFTMVEIIIVIAIMAILVGALAPALMKYVKRSRRAMDIDSARKIADAADRAIVNFDAGTKAANMYTSAVMWNKDSPMENNPSNTIEYAWKELGAMPVCKTNQDYFWIAYYDPVTGRVTKIGLKPSPNSSVEYELYPDSKDFYENGTR